MSSLGSNAVVLSRYLNIDSRKIARLLSTEAVLLNESERRLKEKLEAFCKQNITHFAAKQSGVISMPAPPPNPAAKSVGEVTTLLDLCGFSVGNSIADMRSDKKECVYIAPLACMTYPVNHQFVGSVLQAGTYFSKYNSYVVKDLQECTKLIFSGGTEQGFFERLKTGFSVDHEITPPEWWGSDTFFSYIDTFLPWSTGLTTSLQGDDAQNNTYKINMVSSYGLPYPESSKRDEIKNLANESVNGLVQTLKDADMLLERITQGADPFKKFMVSEEGRPYFAVLAKNKTELMKRENMNKKVRPYFCYSSGLVMLFGRLFAAYSDGVEKASVDNQSMSLIGHSWISGGGERLVDLIREVKDGDCRVMAYADDFFIVIKYVNGDVKLLFPDISQMDASVKKFHIDGFARYIRFVLNGGFEETSDQVLPETYNNVLALWQRLSNQAEVVFPKGVTAVPKIPRLYSGVPGTSRVDEFCSALVAVQCDYSEVFMNVQDDGDLAGRVVRFTQLVAELGFVVKEGTMEVQTFVDGQPIVGPILGQSLVFDDELKEYLPQPLSYRCLASLIYPKAIVKAPRHRQAYGMIVALGVTVSGGCMHEHVYEACKIVWDAGKEADIIPDRSLLSQEEIAGFEGVDFVSMVFDAQNNIKPFPSRQEFKLMYTKAYKPVKVHVNLFEDINVDDIIERLNKLDPKDWADATEIEDLRQEREDKLSGVPKTPALVRPVKKQDERTGLTLEFGQKSHKPGQRPENPKLRREKDAKHKVMVEKANAARAAVKELVVERSSVADKRRAPNRQGNVDIEQKYSESTHPVRGGRLVTVQEAEEYDENVAQKATGLSKTEETLLKKRKLMLESRYTTQRSLSEKDRKAIVLEIEDIDLQLGRA